MLAGQPLVHWCPAGISTRSSKTPLDHRPSAMTDYAIHEAARDNKPQTVSSLLTQDASLAALRDEDDRTALHWACTMNNEPIIEILLPYIRGDIDDLTDSAGWTPLHILAGIGNRSMFRKLMDHDPRPDVNLPTSTGATCLQLAVSKNHYELVEDLIKIYGCLVRGKDKRGSTALHRAAAIGSQPLLKMLADARAAVNVRDTDGWTPLHHALAEGHGDAGVLLVSLGADPALESNSGQTAVQVACSDQVRQFFESLLSQ